jgi:hypothetical protein
MHLCWQAVRSVAHLHPLRPCPPQELQTQWERARQEEESRGAGAADVRRWTGIRNVVEGRELLRTLFKVASDQKAAVSSRLGRGWGRGQRRRGWAGVAGVGAGCCCWKGRPVMAGLVEIKVQLEPHNVINQASDSILRTTLIA